MKDVAELYGSEKTLHGVEEYRRLAGLQAISLACFKAARISVILIDDGLRFDKKLDIDWHKNFTPVVGQILRIEYLAEEILNEVSGTTFALFVKFFEFYVLFCYIMSCM